MVFIGPVAMMVSNIYHTRGGKITPQKTNSVDFIYCMGKGRKEGNVLFNDALGHILFTVIWRQTYGKGPF